MDGYMEGYREGYRIEVVDGYTVSGVEYALQKARQANVERQKRFHPRHPEKREEYRNRRRERKCERE